MRIFVVTHPRMSFWLAMVPGLLAVIAGLSRFGVGAAIPLYLVFMLWTMGSFVWINKQAVNLRRQPMEELDRNCDPEPLLELCRGVLRRQPEALWYRVYEAYCLTLLGREDEARESALLAQGNPGLWKNPGLLLVWSACIPMDDPRQDAVMRALSGLKMNAAARALTIRTLNERKAMRELDQAPEELEQTLLAQLEQAVSQREKLGAHLALGAYYSNRDNEAAETHLRYVLDNANKMHGARVQAERLLCLLPAPGCLE